MSPAPADDRSGALLTCTVVSATRCEAPTATWLTEESSPMYWRGRSAPVKAAQFFDTRVDEWQGKRIDTADYWFRRNELGAKLLARYVRTPARCLDVGCATAHFSELLHRQGHHTYGADVSVGMIQA